MSRERVGLIVLITAGVVASLGCCCPARPFARPIVVAPNPPVIVGQPPIAPPPPPVVPKPPAQDVQGFIAKNLGPNDRAGSLAANSPFWGKLRQEVVKRQLNTEKPITDGVGDLKFSDTLPDGGVLIGFFAGEDNGQHLGY